MSWSHWSVSDLDTLDIMPSSHLFCNFKSPLCVYLSSPIVLVRPVSTCWLQYPCEWDPLCQRVCYVIIRRVMRPGHCDNNNFPALSPNNPLRHGADTQEMGTEWRKWANERGEMWGVDQSEGLVKQWKLWVDIRQHPCYPPLSNINIVWTVVKLLQLPRSLGINKTGRCPLVMEMNGQWNWTTMVNGGHYTSLYQTQRAIRMYRGPGHFNWW